MFSDELISAYLDGELSEQERLQVEDALKSHPEWQQLCDELRDVRDRFALLPPLRAPQGFAQRVLRRAERDLLADDAAGEGRSPHARRQTPAPAASVQPRDRTDQLDRRRGLRALAWTCATLAATLLIAVAVFRSPQRSAVVITDARQPEAPDASQAGSTPAAPQLRSDRQEPPLDAAGPAAAAAPTDFSGGSARPGADADKEADEGGELEQKIENATDDMRMSPAPAEREVLDREIEIEIEQAARRRSPKGAFVAAKATIAKGPRPPSRRRRP